MFEKVNPSHPDKIADRIAGAIVDLAYTRERDPKIAVEVLIGHGECNVIVETSVHIPRADVSDIIKHIVGRGTLNYKEVQQDKHLADNQKDTFRCGDNGIFKGTPITDEQRKLTEIAKDIYSHLPFDGKYVISNNQVTICQSNIRNDYLKIEYPDAIVNPLGHWTGGIDVDTGATNRKLGSDMGDSITGGGLHGKDLSKPDVTLNIYAFLKAQDLREDVQFSCSIGDEEINGMPYAYYVEIVREYIRQLGGFEKLAEWGLIR